MTAIVRSRCFEVIGGITIASVGGVVYNHSLVSSPARSQAILLALHVSRVGLWIAITAVIGRALSAGDFGFFSLVAGLYATAEAVLDLGGGSLATREIARDPGRERPLLEGLLAWRGSIALGLAVAVGALALFEVDPTRRGVWLAVALSMPTLAAGAFYPMFNVRQAQGPPAIAITAGHLLILAGALALAARPIPGVAFAHLLVARQLLVQVLLVVFAARRLGFLPRPGFTNRALGPFVAAAAIFGLSVLLHELYFYADVFLVRWLRGEAELGAYAASFRPINPALTLAYVLMAPLLPALAALDAPRLRERLSGVAALSLGIGALIAAGGVGFAPDIIRILYGGRYLDGALGTVAAFRFLAVAAGLVFVAAPYQLSLLAGGGQRALLALSAIGLGVNVIGNLVSLPRWGFTAAGAMTAVTEAIVAAAALLAIRRRIGWPALHVPLWGAPLLLLVLGALAPGSPLVRVVLAGTVAAIALGLLLRSPSARRLRMDLQRDSEEARSAT